MPDGFLLFLWPVSQLLTEKLRMQKLLSHNDNNYNDNVVEAHCYVTDCKPFAISHIAMSNELFNG